MKKRVLINLLIAFIVIPAVKVAEDYYHIVILDDNKVYSGEYGNYFKDSQHLFLLFICLPIFFAFFVLLPYNMIILKLSKGGGKISLFNKINYLAFIHVMIWILLFLMMGFGTFPYALAAFSFMFLYALSAMLASILHYLVDKKTQ